jgi:hypothetical protein
MTFAGARRGRLQRLVSRTLGVAVAVAMQAGVSSAQPRDCASISSGLLDIELTATASTERSVKLSKGDVLAFAFRGEPHVIGFVTLLAGDGSEERLLLGGTSGASVAHTAKSSGDLGFRFATVGGGATHFTATCTPAAAARRAGRQDPLPGRRLSRLEAQYAHQLGALPEAELGEPPIDAQGLASAPPRADHAALDAGGRAAQARALEPRKTPAIEWEGARNNAGELAGANSDTGPNNLGVKLRLQPAIMVGVLAQFDPVDETRLAPRALSERSWLAGPVTTMQLGQGTSLDARAAWGQLESGPAPGRNAADRRMVDARLSNTQTFGAWRFAPSVSVNYHEETQHIAELGAQTIGSGRVDVRPEVAYRFDMDHGMYIEPKAAIGSFWEIGSAAALGTASPAHPEMRLKAETGVTIGSSDGTKVQVGGSVEEGATPATNVWSGRLQVNVPLK